jgi:nucleoside-diphosphate-sugar epimerase
MKILVTGGAGFIGSNFIHYIIKNNPDGFGVPNAIWLTLDEREKWNLPHQFIIISDAGYGDKYVLDSSQVNSEGEYPVVICHYNGDIYTTEKAYEDFGAFLLAETQLSLEDDEDDIG